MRQLVEWSHGCGRCAAVQHYNDLGLYYLHDIHGTYERCHEDYSGQYTLDPTYFGNVGAWRAFFCCRSIRPCAHVAPRGSSRGATGGMGVYCWVVACASVLLWITLCAYSLTRLLSFSGRANARRWMFRDTGRASGCHQLP